jgi:hypothetical protein
MKSVFAKIIIYSMLFCLAGITSAEDIPVVTNLADLESIVNSTWISNSINRLMPPAKDCMYNNSLGAIAYANGFDTNFIAALTPVVLYNGSNEFVIYPVEVIETNNISGRIRNYYSAISTNQAVLHSTDVSIANYPVSWIENIYGEPPAYLSGLAIQDWYDACDPMRQHVLCDLLPSNSVPDYLTMLTNSVGYYTEGTNTNSVLSLYSNVIAVVQCSINAEDAELYLHAPDDISILDVYKSTNLLEQYSWVLNAVLEHTLDPLRYVAGFDASSIYYSLGNGELDSDGDGLLDARELILFGTDPDSADSDNDGLSDGDEILIYRLDPMNSDTDGDGVLDGEDETTGSPLTIDSVQNGDVLLASSVTVDGTITFSGTLDSVRVNSERVASTNIINQGDGTYTYSHTLELEEGVCDIYVRVVTVGEPPLVSVKTVTVTVDALSSDVTIITPQDGASFDQANVHVTVWSEATNDVVTINGQSTVQDGYIRYAWVTLPSVGTNTIQTSCTDIRSRVSYDSIVVICADTIYIDPEDSDGDGIPDPEDPDPNDPSIRSTVVITSPVNGIIINAK